MNEPIRSILACGACDGTGEHRSGWSWINLNGARVGVGGPELVSALVTGHTPPSEVERLRRAVRKAVADLEDVADPEHPLSVAMDLRTALKLSAAAADPLLDNLKNRVQLLEEFYAAYAEVERLQEQRQTDGRGYLAAVIHLDSRAVLLDEFTRSCREPHHG